MITINEKEWVKSLIEVKQILDEAKIRYWLKDGTLLGAIREGKFLSWDDDIDIGMVHSDAKKVIEKIPELEKQGYRFSIYDYVIKLSKGSVLISIGFYRFEGDNAWIPFGRETWKFNKILNCLYGLAEILLYLNLGKKKGIRKRIVSTLIPSFAFPALRKIFFRICNLFRLEDFALVVPKSYFENLESIDFYNMKFNVPSSPREYLALTYGENWKKPDPSWNWKNSKLIDREFFKNRDRTKYTLI